MGPFDIGIAVMSNAKVQEAAGKAFDAVYSRIFKNESSGKLQQTLELKALTPEQKIVMDRFAAIETRLESMPSDTEMARAFSALQAELRAGQKRLWQIMVPVLALNFMFLSIILLRLFG